MIAIINKGGPPDGVCHYTVQINYLVVAEFDHDRRKGLARCLRDAARAVDRAEIPVGGMGVMKQLAMELAKENPRSR